MKRFAALYRELDRSTATGDKRAALVAYFREAPPRDAAWALFLLAGGKIAGAKKRIANTRELREWITAESGTPDWLVDDSYNQVGDLAETLALLLDDPDDAATDVPLAEWIEGRLLPVANREPELRRAVVVGAWRTLRFDERLLFNKLLTGALRVGVSQRLAQQALAQMSGIDIARIAQRMLGAWTPTPDFLRDLLSHEELPGDRRQPYPFFLASPLESALRPAADAQDGQDGAGDSERRDSDDSNASAVAAALGDIDDWLLEWKWDGIRLQLIRRDGEIALWSRGEERLDGRFPEIEAAAEALPRDCVLDGELLAWRAGDALPMPFTALQKRIQRLKPGPKTLADAPVRMQAYDLLELDGADWRERPLAERRAALIALLESQGEAASSDMSLSAHVNTSSFPRKRESMDVSVEMSVEAINAFCKNRSLDRSDCNAGSFESSTSMDSRLRGNDGSRQTSIVASPRIRARSWADAATLRAGARDRGVEGLMLKRLSSPYQAGRRRGDWWKWKVDPLTIDAVLLYAQSGHGRRSTLYTDYTFGLWDGDTLVPVAKAYSGLDDREILELDKWIRAHTLERFGPVRSVQAQHVFELGFEAVNRSQRHKSGIAVRFPRILRWRRDKPMAEADRLETLQAQAR